MKLLLDENVSWRLAKYLAPHDEVIHVDQTTLALSPTDLTVWEYAEDHGYHILTKDNDFSDLAAIHGPLPKVIRLRNANVSVTFLAEALQVDLPKIMAHLEEDTTAIVVHTL